MDGAEESLHGNGGDLKRHPLHLDGCVDLFEILSFSGATDGLVSFVQGAKLSPTVLLIGMLAILIVLGFFIDEVSIMLITIPFFMPICAI